MRVLQIGRRIVLNGRKIALAVAGCISRCCGSTFWNRATLCNPSDVPPEIPRDITFPVGFICGDGCPISGSRIIIYRGYCYNVESGPGNVECQGTRPKPREYPAPYFGATQAAWVELLCKPLASDCSDESCLPTEPGCCTLPYEWRDCTNQPVVCNLPKKFRVRRVAYWRWRSTTYTDAGSCTGLNTCEEVVLEIDGYADYACQETGAQTQAVCTNVSGFVRVSGWVDSGGTGTDLNGTYPFGVAVGSLFQGFAPGFSGADASAFGIDGSILYRLHAPLASFPFCSGSHSFISDPPNCYQRTVTCPGGPRTVLRETANCVNGTLDHTVYRDCFLWDQTYQSTGNSVYPCPTTDIRWDDLGSDRITLSGLVGCESQPAWTGGLVTSDRPPLYPGQPSGTAGMLEAMGE